MGKFIDRTGETYGTKIVVGREGSNIRGVALWRLRCNCGKETVVSTTDLQRNQTCIRCGKFEDLTGRRFGTRTVVECMGISQGHMQWRARCDCGHELVTTTASVRKAKRCKHCWIKLFKRAIAPGDRFGRLVAIRQTRVARYVRIWLFRCDCKTEKELPIYDVLYDRVRSCGCLRLERNSRPPGIAARHRTFAGSKYAAFKRGLAFELTESEYVAIAVQSCHYCGKAPTPRKGRDPNGSFVANGLDRVDSTKGYTLDNVVPCCTMCNRAKSNHSTTDFLSWIKRVYEHNFKCET